jgi:hypothetical protein
MDLLSSEGLYGLTVYVLRLQELLEPGLPRSKKRRLNS